MGFDAALLNTANFHLGEGSANGRKMPIADPG
jgi:hypothetical protein